MYQADYQPGVKLYVKRVFITDDDKDLLPPYLRFVKGIIDSEDLPLNVSREILQKNKILSNIKTASVKKILGEIQNLVKDEEKYKTFIEQFNRPLKEGLYTDFGNRETLLELVRYKSTTTDGWVSLENYKDRMQSDQKSIFYITGGNETVLKNSPLLEAYKKKGIEVLVMDEDIDEIVAPMIGTYKDISLKAVNKSGSSEEIKTDEDREKEKEMKPVIDKIKEALKDEVKDVVASSRLQESPSCIVSDENDPSAQLQQMMKALGQTDMPEVKPILEINPRHEIICKLQNTEDKQILEDISRILLDQALMVEGVPVKDPAAFAARLNKYIGRSLNV